MGLIIVIPTVIIMGLLIIVGGIYTCTYEKAPIEERLRILGIGWGMGIGAAILLFS